MTEIQTFSSHEHKSMLTDEIEATAVQGLVPERYIDFDLGKAYSLTSIELYPYLKSELTKGNYELLYWDNNDWNSVCTKTANASGYLTFDNVPVNTLMMLKSRDKGWEGFSSERTFLYKEKSIHWE